MGRIGGKAGVGHELSSYGITGDKLMIRKNLFLAAAATFLVLLASCGSTSDIFGGGNGNTNNSTIHGAVDAVDLNNSSSVLMNTSAYNTTLSPGGGTYGGNS